MATLSCSPSDVTGPTTAVDSRAQSDSARLFGLPIFPRLLNCPSSESYTTSSVVDALGGTLSVGGATVVIPVGALLGPVTMTLTVPASNYMEVDVSVEGTNSFLFELPVTVSIDYSRCTSWRAILFPNTAYHIDTETKSLLERMPSVDNKALRTVTFTTGHLSGYALAN